MSVYNETVNSLERARIDGSGQLSSPRRRTADASPAREESPPDQDTLTASTDTPFKVNETIVDRRRGPDPRTARHDIDRVWLKA